MLSFHFVTKIDSNGPERNFITPEGNPPAGIGHRLLSLQDVRSQIQTNAGLQGLQVRQIVWCWQANNTGSVT